MKKRFKYVLVAALAVAAVSANAQLGVKLGYVNSNFRAKSEGVVLKPSALNGINLGLNYDIALPVTGLSIRPGLSYTYVGGEQFQVKQREHFMNIPIDIKYAYSFNDNFAVYGFAGPKFAIGLASISKLTADGVTGTYNNYTGKTKVSGGGGSASGGGDDDSGQYSRFDLQLGFGAGVQFRAFSFELGYDWGLVNRLKKSVADGATIKRGQFVMGFGYNF